MSDTHSPGSGTVVLEQQLLAGIAAVKERRLGEGRKLLQQVIDRDERNELAWLWLSGAVTTDEDRRICLENVLSINPHNLAARGGLAQLAKAPPAGLAGQPDESNEASADLRGPESGAFRTQSRYDDVWSREAEICPYCAHEIEDEEEWCPRCRQKLTTTEFRYEKAGANLHILWVLLAGLGQLFFLSLFGDIASQAGLPLLVFHASVTAVLFVLALGVYLRQSWAYPATIVALLVLLFLQVIGQMGIADMFLPLAENPVEAMITMPFIAIIGDIVVVLQLMATVLALFWAVFLAGPDFVRDTRRHRAHAPDRYGEPSTFFATGQEYAGKGMWATAVRHWERAAANDPANAYYQRRLALGYARLGFYERSLDLLHSAKKLAANPAVRAEIEQLTMRVRDQQRGSHG